MRRALLLALAAGCGGAPVAPAPRAAAPIVGAVTGGVLVPLACGGGAAIDRRGCLARLPAAARVRVDGGEVALGGEASSRCGEPGRALAARDGALAVWPPDAALVAPGGAAEPAEIARIEAQLIKTDPSLHGPATASAVLVADLDGDGRDDRAYAAGVPGLQAVLLAASSFPARLKILQFSDLDPYELLGAVDLDPARPGRQLVVRTGGDLDVVLATGEVVGGLHCP